MRPLPPDPVFRAALLSALAACGPTQAGAPPPEPAPMIPEAAPSGERLAAPGTVPGSPPLPPAVGCGLDHQALPGGDLSPAWPLDALLLRFDRPAGLFPGQRDVARTEGRVCAGAADRGACLEALGGDRWPTASLLTTCGGPVGCTHWHLAWTAGDRTGLVTDRPSLLALLGPIDTVGEATLLTWLEAMQPSCAPAPTRDGDGWVVSASKRVSDCPIQTDQYRLRIGADGTVTVLEHAVGQPTGACVGRLPEGTGLGAPADGTPAAWLAWAAGLEAAAVPAFERLAAELVHHGAPPALVQAARAAADDERRHAARVGALARSFGAEPEVPPVGPGAARSLEALAIENAAEGCVREAVGAAIGCWQARRAADPRVRAVLAEVSADEVRHAELSRAVHRWALDRLAPAARRRVQAARRRAIRRLRTTLAAPVPEALAGPLGLPSPAAALALADAVLAAA